MNCDKQVDKVEKIYMVSGVALERIETIERRLEEVGQLAQANIDNTDTGNTVVKNGKLYYILEDGTEVEAKYKYVDLAGNRIEVEANND